MLLITLGVDNVCGGGGDKKALYAVITRSVVEPVHVMFDDDL